MLIQKRKLRMPLKDFTPFTANASRGHLRIKDIKSVYIVEFVKCCHYQRVKNQCIQNFVESRFSFEL